MGLGETARPRTGRKVLRTAVSVILIAAAFGFVLPLVASYSSVWATVQLMTWPYALLVATAAVASMAAYWITIRAVLPWIGIRQAAAVSLGSNAVANSCRLVAPWPWVSAGPCSPAGASVRPITSSTPW